MFRRKTKLQLELPPALDRRSAPDLQDGSVSALLPQAAARLAQLCPVDELQLGRVIGRGGISSVQRLTRSGTNEEYAVKVFNLFQPGQSVMLSAEVRALLALDCECLVGFQGAWTENNCVYLVLEAMRLGSLFDMIHDSQAPLMSCPNSILRWRNTIGASAFAGQQCMITEVEETAVLAIVFQMLWGLRNMHSIGLVHRDVKPSNILLNTCGAIKLADFGSSAFENECINSVGSTFRYMPKESIVQGTFGTAGDVWAAGLVMAELFTHQAPFASCDTQVEIMQLMEESDDNMIVWHVLPGERGAPESITYLVSQCLRLDPDMRPSLATLLASPVFAARGLTSPEDAREVLGAWLQT